MKNIYNLSSSFTNNKSLKAKSELDTTSSLKVSEEDCSSLNNSSKSTYKYRPKIRKRSNDICYTLSFYERYGNIYISHNLSQIFIAKIRKVNVDDNFQELFEKGKTNLGNYFKEDVSTIPDITFWYQRYYYYQRFDEGILMDNESWWSVTPEELAKYTATLCEGKTVADGFCGSGGNVIQFSKFCKKVYAIDIDERKLALCRNNAKVYECINNIEFIQSDYLKLKNKLKVDYVFLSPPWGGIKYKDSDVYCIKELMTPNIYDIIKVSLNIAKNIIFYLPRTLLLDELFEILSTILNSETPGNGDRIFFDVHVLKSAKKIKALMIIFGNDIKEINTSDLSEYINFNYPNINAKNLQILTTVAKIVGNYKFIKTEFYLRKQYIDTYIHPVNLNMNFVTHAIDSNTLISHFYELMTEQEKVKLKSLNILKSGVMHRMNRNSHKKNYSISFPISPDNIKTDVRVFYPVKEIQMEFISTSKTAMKATREIYSSSVHTVHSIQQVAINKYFIQSTVPGNSSKFSHINLINVIKPKRIISSITKNTKA